jgi:hypothetical protein
VTEACRKNGRKVFCWFSWRMEELRKTDEGGFTLIELLAVITLLFHKQPYHSRTRPN